MSNYEEIITSFLDYVVITHGNNDNIEHLRFVLNDYLKTQATTETKSKSKKTNVDFDKIKVGTKCGYSVAYDRYAFVIKEYKELPRNTHLLYLERQGSDNDIVVFKYNKNDEHWYLFEDNKVNKKRKLDFSITENYLDPNF
jgi:hypothetical protein